MKSRFFIMNVASIRLYKLFRRNRFRTPEKMNLPVMLPHSAFLLACDFSLVFATYIISFDLAVAANTMRFDGTFEIRAGDKKVFDFLTDARRMASLVPDVENLQISDDGEIRMSVKVGLSFIKGKFNLKMKALNANPNTTCMQIERTLSSRACLNRCFPSRS